MVQPFLFYPFSFLALSSQLQPYGACVQAAPPLFPNVPVAEAVGFVLLRAIRYASAAPDRPGSCTVELNNWRTRISETPLPDPFTSFASAPAPPISIQAAGAEAEVVPISALMPCRAKAATGSFTKLPVIVTLSFGLVSPASI